MNPSTNPTPEKPLWTRTWDALIDIDPVVAKELLVTARTPIFRRSMVGAPLLLGALVLLVQSGMSHLDADAGRRLFPVYFIGLSIALGTVGAALASTVVVQEREAGALEALKFSALSLHRLVLGKFAAVVLAELAIVVATLPLLAFVVACGGVSNGETAVAMSIALACGVMTASVGVAISAHAANTRRSLLNSLLASGAVGIGMAIWLIAGSELGPWYGTFGIARAYFEASPDATYVPVLFVVPAFALTSVLWLSHAAATSGLMDLAEDRSLPIKRWVLAAYAMGALSLAVSFEMVEARVRAPIAGASMIAIAIVATILLFVFVGEPLRPTRRMQAQPRSSFVRVFYPWTLAPSILFAVGASGIVLLAAPALMGVSAQLEFDAFWAVACLSTLGGCMGSVAARRGAAPARRLGVTVMSCFGLLFVLLRTASPGPTWADWLWPLWLDPEGGQRVQYLMKWSVVAWGTLAFASLATMLLVVRSRANPRAAS